MKIRLFNRYWFLPAAVSLTAEITLILTAFAIAHRLRSVVFFGSAKLSLAIYSPQEFWIRASMFTLVFVFFLYMSGLYDFEERQSKRQLAIQILKATTLTTVTLWGAYFALPGLSVGRGVFLLSLLGACMFVSLWRLAFNWIAGDRVFVERILIVGADAAARELAREVLAREHLGYRVVGFVSDTPGLQGMSLVNPRVIGTTSETFELASAQRATRVVVAQQDSRGKVSLDNLLKCKTRGIPVLRSSTYYEQLTGKVLLDGKRVKSWLIFSPGFVVSRPIVIVKRIFDVIVSSVALTLQAPLIALLALAIRLDSRGGAFYLQERVGRHGKAFTMVKFRTMTEDAESSGEARWAEEDDPRVTRVGRILRKLRLDEIPQLWNIMKGDMSLVGPRPERQPFVDELIDACPLYEERLAVRPGLTGWAQIRAPYAASVEDSMVKLKYDLYYIKNLSFFLDLSILASTFRIVLFGRGAR